MAQTPRVRVDHQIAASQDPKAISSWIVFLLAVMFFGGAVIIVLAARYLQIDPVWELLAVPFNFAMTGALTYVINADELPSYLLPMIKNCKTSFYATQYVFPEKFWGQYWANQYFDENVKAVKERNVRLQRIFIIDAADGPGQAKVIDDLIQRHVQKGIPLRLIDRREYLKAHNNNDDDLQDVLIVDDQLSGFLLLNKGGNFNRVEFSINRDIVEQRKRNYERLLASSMSCDDWKVSHPSKLP